MVGPVARIEAGTSRSAGRTNPARVKREGGARLYFAYVFCPLPYAGLKNRGLASSMGQFVGE